MTDEAWNMFTLTGKVTDYLTYSHEKYDAEVQKDQSRGECGYGADHSIDRDGFDSNAHW